MRFAAATFRRKNCSAPTRSASQALDPQLRAFVRVFEAPTGGDGPLAGVPVTIKDSFDIAGYPTLTGSLYRTGHTAAADATAVARLIAAGAVILGKTNCPEFLANYETDNHITGWTANPWNLDRTRRRLQRRRGRGHRRRLLRGRYRQRWRRIHPCSRPLLWHRRAETDAGPGLRGRPPSRYCPSRRSVGRRRSDGAHRPRRPHSLRDPGGL